MKFFALDRIYTQRSLFSAPVLALAFSSFSANASGYAEDLYKDFSEFSGNQIVFEVIAAEPESLASSKNLSVGSFVLPGSHVVNYRLGGLAIQDVKFEDGSLNSALTQERQEKMTEYEEDLLPMSSGTFRLLSVKASIGKDVRLSEAVEFCWTTKGYCYVADNSIPNLYGAVLTIRHLIASGYQETVTYGEPLAAQSRAKVGACVIQGTTKTSKTKNNSATSNTPVYAGRNIVGYTSMPASYVTQNCITNSNRTCSVAQDYSVPNVSGSANRGYSIACPASVKVPRACENRVSFASEQGCAFGLARTIWGFGLNAGPAGCSASADYSNVNTVAITTRALDQSITCVFTR